MSLYAPTSVGDQPTPTSTPITSPTPTPSPRHEIARIAVPVSAEFVLTLVLQVATR